MRLQLFTWFYSKDPNPENAKDSSTQETIFSQHLLVVALQELGALVNGLASAASPLLADQVFEYKQHLDV